MPTPVAHTRSGATPASAQGLERRGAHHRVGRCVLRPAPPCARQGLCVEVADRDSAEVRVHRVARTTPAVGLNFSVAGGRPPVDAAVGLVQRGRGASSEWTRSASVERESPLWSAPIGSRRSSPPRTIAVRRLRPSWPRPCPRVNQTSRRLTDGSPQIEFVFSRAARPESVNLLLDIRAKRDASVRLHVWRRGSRRHCGDGVHGCCPRSFGAACGCTPGRRRRVLAREELARRRGARRRTLLRHCGGARRVAGRRRRPHLHAQPPAPAPGRSRAGRRQARHLREAAGDRRPRRRGDGSTRRSRPGVATAVPFVYRYYPTVREARERIRDRASAAPIRLIHGGYLQDWLLKPDRRQLARRRVDRRRVARVRRHRLALVRPRRVRVRVTGSRA